MKKSTSFNLLAALVLVPALTAPAFAEDGKDAPGRASSQTVQSVTPESQLLTPAPRQWWKDN